MIEEGLGQFRLFDEMQDDLSEQETLEFQVSDVVYRGRGLARLDNRVIFLRHVLPGEIVRARVTKKRKQYWEAHLLELLEPAAARIEPFCPLFSECPGCCYQHVEYRTEIQLKQSQFVDLLGRIGGVKDGLFLKPVPSPVDRGYRNKIVLHSRNVTPEISVGYFGYDNTSIVDVPGCPLACHEINDRLRELRNDRSFLRSMTYGGRLVLRHTRRDGVVHFVGTEPEEIGACTGFERKRLVEETSVGAFTVPVTGFFQINLPVADLVIFELARLLEHTAARQVIDLYCGVGVFAVAAAKVGIPAVSGIDRDLAAICAARKNAETHGLNGLSFVAESAAIGLSKATARSDPRTTAVIVDPPRRGLDRSVIRAVARFKPAHLFYVSCAADTLSRDVKALASAGYLVESARLFDMFPRTPYFESVTHLVHQP